MKSGSRQFESMKSEDLPIVWCEIRPFYECKIIHRVVLHALGIARPWANSSGAGVRLGFYSPILSATSAGFPD